jgi:transposase-like protein
MRPRNSQLPPGKRRRQVANLLEQGFGISETAERLGVSKPTVCYHARKLGIPPQSAFARRYDWEEIRRVYESGVSQRECRRRFGFSNDAWHEAVKRGDVVPRDRLIPLEELLVKGRRTSRGHLKGRLIKAGLKEDRCEKCEINEWWGRPLSAQLHHRNGDGTDNRLINLEFLCPNCHAQTENWGGRNVKRKTKPDLKLVA